MPHTTDILIYSLYSIIPVVVIMYYVYSRDKFPEPLKVVSIIFLLGIATVFPIWLLIPIVEGFAEKLYLTGESPYFYQSFVRAAFLEETAKWMVLLVFCIKRNEFNEPMDALIYGVAVSLGFAAFENWIYVIEPMFENDLELAASVAILRSFTAVPLHATAGVFMGLFLIKAVFGKRYKKMNLLLSLLIPITIHGTYNYIIFSPNIIDYLIVPLLILIILSVNYIFKKEREKQERKIIETEIKYGTITLRNIVSSILITLFVLTVAVFILNK
jgi:RsiW-degrading membrane proteinase PrsW (M82 family)